MKKIFENIGKTEIRNTIAVVFVLAVLGYIYLLVFKPVPLQNSRLIDTIGGYILGCLSTVMGYYFGASKTDNRKQ